MGPSSEHALLPRSNSRGELKRSCSWGANSEYNLTPCNDAAAPGFAGATDLPACREPVLAFQLLCDGAASAEGAGPARQGISMQNWVRLAPGMASPHPPLAPTLAPLDEVSPNTLMISSLTFMFCRTQNCLSYYLQEQQMYCRSQHYFLLPRHGAGRLYYRRPHL